MEEIVKLEKMFLNYKMFRKLKNRKKIFENSARKKYLFYLRNLRCLKFESQNKRGKLALVQEPKPNQLMIAHCYALYEHDKIFCPSSMVKTVGSRFPPSPCFKNYKTQLLSLFD